MTGEQDGWDDVRLSYLDPELHGVVALAREPLDFGAKDGDVKVEWVDPDEDERVIEIVLRPEPKTRPKPERKVRDEQLEARLAELVEGDRGLRRDAGTLLASANPSAASVPLTLLGSIEFTRRVGADYEPVASIDFVERRP